MTSVVFKKLRGNFKNVTVSGHSGYAEEGEDIVCSAISSAMQLIHILLDDVILLNIDTSVDPKQAYISITLPSDMTMEESREAQHALRALRMHFGELEENYAQFINVTEVQYDA